MRFTTINTNVDITNDLAIESIPEHKTPFPLEISVYVEDENVSRHITINISPEIDIDGFDIWLDLDIYQAELLAKKLDSLVHGRKMFLRNKMKE